MLDMPLAIEADHSLIDGIQHDRDLITLMTQLSGPILQQAIQTRAVMATATHALLGTDGQ